MLTQIARLLHNCVNSPHLKKNIGHYSDVFSVEINLALAKITTLYFEMALISRVDDNCNIAYTTLGGQQYL